MNGNRMKYSTTPTYGMQKRSFLKKPAPVRKAPETPDFSQAPDPVPTMPFTQNTVPAAQQPYVQSATPMQSYPQPVPQQSYYTQPQAVPFAAPTFVPQSGGMPIPPMQGMNATVPQQQPLPLGNTVPPFSGAGGYAARTQGFVPPTVQPQQPFTPNVPPIMPNAQPVPVRMQPQQTAFQPVQPPPNVSPAAAPASRARSAQIVMDADKLWSVFLFGLLPLLFIPCLFVPDSWDVLRYVFLGLTVVGLGGMWYRQMYASTTRLIVSIVYVALCIATLAMLLQGSSDVQLASGANQPQFTVSVQQTPTPDDAQVFAAAAVTATPEPVSGPSEAERRLELFMTLWQTNNATEMVSLVQPSWCSQQENPSQALFTVLKNRTPEDFIIEEISGTETDNSRTVTMRATINKNNGKAAVVYRFMIMMVKEGGEWYVNPNSLATNDEVETTDENVVNNKNAVGDTTEPPRTTVTPAPAAATTLYYNQGGSYYHMDPNCSSVKAEYLPFDHEFSYADLKTVKSENNLSPCLKCNAPTNTLD